MIRYRERIAAAIAARVFYGWAIVLVAGVAIMASGPGQSHTFSVFIDPISRDLGIGATALSGAYGFATLVAAFGLPLMGRLVDRHGPSRMMLIVVVLLGAACIAFGLVPGMVWLAFAFGALRFLGQGSLMLTSANVVSQWFSRKRGLAMSMMMLGFSASMAVHPPASQWLIEQVGWREAWFWLGLSTWIVMVPLILLLLHDVPERLGLIPDGGARETAPAPGAGRVSPAWGLTLAEALRTRTFYIVAAGLFTMSMLVTSLHFFQVAIFTHHGLSATTAAWIFPLSAVTAVVVQPFFGRSLDRFATPRMFGASLLVLCASLVSITLVRDPLTAVIYGVIFGVNNAASITLFGYLWPRYFGRRYLGSIQGTGQMIGVVGASLGPLPLGIAVDLTGDYSVMLWSLAVIPLLVAVLTQFLKETGPAEPGH